MTWTITYYNEKVQKTINEWPVSIRAYYAKTTKRIKKHGPNLGLPFTKAMGKGLFEIRAKGKEGIGRAFFCTIVRNRVVVLHAFIKKTDKTPKNELDLAKQRLKEVKNVNT